MYFGHIAGLAFLPVAVLGLLNTFGITNIPKIFGMEVIFLASIGIIATEVGDIVSSHVGGSKIILTYITGSILCFPGILYLLSKIITFPTKITASLSILVIGFLFVEAVSSLHIGE
jgi:hypothetical protein